MNQRQNLLDLLEKNPKYRERKYRYIVISTLTGVDEDLCKKICSVADDYRHITQVDEVGESLAENWKKSDAIHTFENQLFKPRPITSL